MKEIRCARLCPPRAGRWETALAVVAAIELSVRNPAGDGWIADIWDELRPLLSSVGAWARPGVAGAIVAAWPSDDHDETLTKVATVALELRALADSHHAIDLRGAIAIGVTGPEPARDAVEGTAEQLALVAAPGQWLVTLECARRLESRFEFGGVGIVPRWPLQVPAEHRALVTQLTPPSLPSAVAGDPPELVLGRDVERRELLAALETTAAGRRRIILVTAPAGGGKSHLLRRVLADTDLDVAAGVAFPPLGARPLDQIGVLLTQLGATSEETRAAGGAGAHLGEVACARARQHPTAIVVDDVHWADPESLTALRAAIVSGDADVPLAWVLSARTASLPQIVELADLSDTAIALRPLAPADRCLLLEHRLHAVPGDVRRHVEIGDRRGNPLYLEHLSAILSGSDPPAELPGSLHQAVLARLAGLAEQARALGRWPRSGRSPRSVEALEREVGDWLDRLEASDLAELETIGRYLGQLRRVDFELVIARALFGMPVRSNRRLTQAIERLSAASTSALLDYLATLAGDGRREHAAQEAGAAARRAELALRLTDAQRLLAFACEQAEEPLELRRRHGDLALALGCPEQALDTYRAAQAAGDTSLELVRRTARAHATAGRVESAVGTLEALAADISDEGHLAILDLARLRGHPPPVAEASLSVSARRHAARVTAWGGAGETAPARSAARLLTLDREPAACAAELIEAAALARFAGLRIAGLADAARHAATALGNHNAELMLTTSDPERARSRFLHWEV